MVNKEQIGIVSWGAVSALGIDKKEVWEQYLSPKTLISYSTTYDTNTSTLLEKDNQYLHKLQLESKYYAQLDRSVLLSILVSRQAVQNSNWKNNIDIGVNIGSSRGATQLFERFHTNFLQKENLKDDLLTSPLTTLGNISSWTAKDIGSTSLAFSHSMTCSTTFHSILNGIACLQSGFSKQFLVGGSEAPITPFTIAQMQALRIYNDKKSDYPCQAMDLKKTRNSMILGEGAAVFAIENKPKKPVAWINGIGFATESIEHPTSISKQGISLQKSMEMAMQYTDKSDIDIVITHSPGTIRGDQSEWNAIQQVFQKNSPAITCNKWKIGHTLGASGGLSLELGLLMILHNQFIPIPYLADSSLGKYPDKIENILINTVGFGGTAVSILISKPTNHL